MIYLLLALLVVIFIVNFFVCKKDIISPAFIFTFGFMFQTVWAVLYAGRWDLQLHLNTFLVIFLGVLEFSLVCYIVSYIYSKINKRIKNKTVVNITEKSVEKDKKEDIENKIKKINTNKIFEILLLVVCIIISCIYLWFVVKAVNGSFESFKSITMALSKYDSSIKFSDKSVHIPFIISNLELFVIAVGYWFTYVIINNFFVEKKIDIIKILIVLVSLVSSTLSGSRGIAFMMIAASILYFMVILSKKKNYTNILSLKLIRNIAIIGIVFMATFYSFANLLGRNIKGNKFDYLAIYCGAEVKNLDVFLQEDNYKKDNKIFGSQTFINVVTTIGEKIGFKDYKSYKLDLPFRNHAGFSLGNVYTTFYPFIYDFGYLGEFVLVLIMAIISQLVYEHIKNKKECDVPLISSLVYGIIFCCLLLSFFSNKFYENVFSMGMVKYIIFWVILNYVLCKFKWQDLKKIIRRK